MNLEAIKKLYEDTLKLALFHRSQGNEESAKLYEAQAEDWKRKIVSGQ